MVEVLILVKENNKVCPDRSESLPGCVCVCVPTMLLSCPMTKAVSGGWIYSGLRCEEMQSIMVEFQVLEAVGWGLLVASW